MPVKIIAWSMLGAILGFVLVYGGFEFYYRVFEPVATNDADGIRAWQSFNAMMIGGLGAAVGFIAGLVSGFVRSRKKAGELGAR